MRRISWTAAIAAGLTGAMVLTGCGGGQSAGGPAPASGGDFTGEYDGPDVTLSYWNGFTGGDGPFMQDLVDQFNKDHANIKVESNTIQWADFYQRVPAAVQAGQGPDVGVMHLDQLATHAARNIIVPVDDLAKGIGLTEDDFTPEIWNAGIYKDKRYGIPLDVHSLAMYYNKDHFEKAGISEPPTDEASFKDALDKLQAAGYKTPFWMPSLWPSHLMFLTLSWQNGEPPYGEDGQEATYGSDAGVSALEWQRSMVDDGYSPPNVAIDSQYAAFKNGQNSITWDGIWQINDLEANNINYGIAPVPTIGDEDAVWANSHHFFISTQGAKDKNKLAASQVFIAWMSEHSADWAGSGMIPARESVRADAVKGLPQEVIADQIGNMRFLPPVPGLGGVQAEALEPAVANGVLGEADPAESLKSAASKANQLMQRNRESFGN
ncbi:MAG: transporter substrate-binding protein [Blastococcus sp.]|jgi:multiple sugar transport system substrate-binding protein|nr:transporter substrate-binding protein [Blastococcus sp.]